jgi:hypothetical protein
MKPLFGEARLWKSLFGRTLLPLAIPGFFSVFG